jgi:hypothetical protein
MPFLTPQSLYVINYGTLADQPANAYLLLGQAR